MSKDFFSSLDGEKLPLKGKGAKPKKVLVSVNVPSVLKPDMSHMRVARILAVQSIFSWDGDAVLDYDKNFSWNTKAEKKEREAAVQFMDLVISHMNEINQILASFETAWHSSRITPINTSILKLAIAEMYFGDLDKKIVINEAVEISKAFGEEKDYKFINAFLDKISSYV